MSYRELRPNRGVPRDAHALLLSFLLVSKAKHLLAKNYHSTISFNLTRSFTRPTPRVYETQTMKFEHELAQTNCTVENQLFVGRGAVVFIAALPFEKIPNKSGFAANVLSIIAFDNFIKLKNYENLNYTVCGLFTVGGC